MDIVTQGLLGATVAQAGYSKKIGVAATFWGFVLGLLPDLDIVAGFFGPWVSLKYHRGPTHSFLVLPLIAVSAGLLIKKITKSDLEAKYWVGLSFWCLMTHPIIDWFTAYGTCLFWPLTSRRFAIDALSIIDAIFSMPLMIAFAVGISRLFSSSFRMKVAIIALIASTLYAGLGYYNSQKMVAEGSKIFLSQGFEPTEIRATPTMMNINVFRVIAKDSSNQFMLTYLNASDNNQLIAPVLFEPDEGSYVDVAVEHRHSRLFKWFAMDMVLPRLFVDDEEKKTVLLQDMRYGLLTDPEAPMFSATIEFDADGMVKKVTRNSPRDNGSSFKEDVKATLSFVLLGTSFN